MFIVLEIQRENGVTSVLPYTFDTINEAKAKYYAILSAAALTTIELHGSCIIVSSTGSCVMREIFDRTSTQ